MVLGHERLNCSTWRTNHDRAFPLENRQSISIGKRCTIYLMKYWHGFNKIMWYKYDLLVTRFFLERNIGLLEEATSESKVNLQQIVWIYELYVTIVCLFSSLTDLQFVDVNLSFYDISKLKPFNGSSYIHVIVSKKKNYIQVYFILVGMFILDDFFFWSIHSGWLNHYFRRSYSLIGLWCKN